MVKLELYRGGKLVQSINNVRFNENEANIGFMMIVDEVEYNKAHKIDNSSIMVHFSINDIVKWVATYNERKRTITISSQNDEKEYSYLSILARAKKIR